MYLHLQKLVEMSQSFYSTCILYQQVQRNTMNQLCKQAYTHTHAKIRMMHRYTHIHTHVHTHTYTYLNLDLLQEKMENHL